jgi:hypothetical protein
MVKRIYMLMGPLQGIAVSDLADADGTAAVTDGWGRELLPTGPYPFDSSGELPKASSLWPNSLRDWLTKTYGTAALAYPNSVVMSVLSISKANPTVITVSAASAAGIANGDRVKFSGTTVAALDNAASPLTVGGKTGSTFTVPVDLSLIPAPVTNTGTVTELVP